MAIEIEHKFLLANDSWRALVTHSENYQQGYLSSNSLTSIRVRLAADKAWLNLKSATIGTQRDEYEYPIPITDASEIITNLCQPPLIEKTRHFVNIQQHIWEIDEFWGENAGLIVAEIELSHVNEKFLQPSWLGLEVTGDIRYYNNQLCQQPYTTW